MRKGRLENEINLDYSKIKRQNLNRHVLNVIPFLTNLTKLAFRKNIIKKPDRYHTKAATVWAPIELFIQNKNILLLDDIFKNKHFSLFK